MKNQVKSPSSGRVLLIAIAIRAGSLQAVLE